MKTLNDLKWFKPEITGEWPDFEISMYERCGCDKNGLNTDVFNSPEITNKKMVLVDDLRQEAIKWINAFKECELSTGGLCKPNMKCIGFYDNSDYHEHGAVIDFLKHFFNITEDDLK